jgi:hypothetical protein
VVKRIWLLIVAALMAAMMTVATAAPAFAAPDCGDPQHADHPNCTEETLPSGNEPQGQGDPCGNNPNCDPPEFEPGLSGGGG